MNIWRGAIVAVPLLFVVIAMLGDAETRLECSGRMSSKAGLRPETIQARVEAHYWGLGALRKSKRSFWLEIPGELPLKYTILRDYGDILDLDLGDDRGLGGTFSSSRKEIAVRTPQGLFVGTCSIVG